MATISRSLNLSSVNFGQMDRITDGGQRRLLKKEAPLRVSGLWGSEAVKGKGSHDDGRGKKKEEEEEEEKGGYKGRSRRLPLGDGSQMSDPGPLRLIVKQKPHLLFLSASHFLLFALFPFNASFLFFSLKLVFL